MKMVLFFANILALEVDFYMIMVHAVQDVELLTFIDISVGKNIAMIHVQTENGNIGMEHALLFVISHYKQLSLQVLKNVIIHVLTLSIYIITGHAQHPALLP